MILIAFFAVCAGGAALAQLTEPFRRLGPVVGLASLAAACATALLIGPADGFNAGDVQLVGSTYAGTFLAAATAATLLICLVGLGSGWPDRLVPGALAAFGGLGVALTATDPRVALAAAAAAATAGAVVSLRSGAAGEEPDNRLSEARTLALLVGSLLVAATVVSRPSWASGDGPAFVVGFLGLGTALAIRSGAIPFHVPAARLGKHGTSMAPALLLVWIPAGIGLMAVSWSAITFGIRDDWLDAAATVVAVVAVATLVLGAVGALLHDDLAEIVIYSIVQDSAFILLALASRDSGAAEPARMWLLAFVAAKTAFVGWAAAASGAFGTPDLGKLRGWLRRAPILGLALVAIAAATLGWPGSPVFEARSTLIDLALPDRLRFVSAVAVALSLGYYGRLLLVGLLPPADAVRAASGERPRLSLARRGVAGESGTEATATAEATAAVKPKRRKSRVAAAAELVPVKSDPLAAVSQADAATASASPHAGSGWRGRFLSLWSLNRTLEVSGAVLAAAALALTLAFGGLGASNASRGGIPFDIAAHATSSPSPSPTPSPTPSSEPTFAPIATHQLGPSASPGSSSPPTGSPVPTRSSKPNPVPKN